MRPLGAVLHALRMAYAVSAITMIYPNQGLTAPGTGFGRDGIPRESLARLTDLSTIKRPSRASDCVDDPALPENTHSHETRAASSE